MDHWVQALLGAIVRVAVVQAVAVGVLACLIGRRWPNCPKACRWACILILLQGWILSPWTLSIPWYDAPSPVRSALPPGSAVKDRQDTVSLPGHSRTTPEAQPTPNAAPARHGAAWIQSGVWFLAVAWATGAALIAVVMLWRYARFLRAIRPEPARPEWLDEWNSVLRDCGARRPIPLIVTRRLGPMLCLRPGGPAVLVPADLWKSISPPSRQAILRHELAHYRRGDAWKSLAVRLLALPQWFSPAVWWVVRMFQQCGEWTCDRRAARTDSERVHYARGLAQLAGLRLAVGGVGACAHSHPLVLRVQMLLQSPPKENGPMRKLLVLMVAGLLLVLGAVRVELVAKEPVSTRESVENKIEQLDKAVADLGARLEGLKQSAAALNKQVEERLAKLAEVYQPGNFSDPMRKRLADQDSGDEVRELAAIDDAQSLGDEGVVLLALAASRSGHAAVRRKALEKAMDWGTTAYPALAHAFESLGDADRLILAGLAIRKPGDENLIVLGLVVRRSSPEARKAVIDLAAKSPKRVLLFAVIAAEIKDDEALTAKMIGQAAGFEGDEGLTLLYALVGRGPAAQQVAALKAAAARKQEALPVLAAAFKAKDPQVRAELVRGARAIGGPVAEYAIQTALADPDESLRNAAAKAMQDLEARTGK